jgi:hypothetical protein
MLPSDEAACLDCGHPISLCDHAVKRLTDPGASFSAGIIEDLAAERDRLRAALLPEWLAGGYWCVICQQWSKDRETIPHQRGCAADLGATTATETERAGPPREGAE